jgi:hypothetical protein
MFYNGTFFFWLDPIRIGYEESAVLTRMERSQRVQ